MESRTPTRTKTASVRMTTSASSTTSSTKKRATSLRKMVRSARKAMEQRPPTEERPKSKQNTSNPKTTSKKRVERTKSMETTEVARPTSPRERPSRRKKAQSDALPRNGQTPHNHLRKSLPYSVKGIPKFSGRSHDDSETSLGSSLGRIFLRDTASSNVNDSSWGTLCTSAGSTTFGNTSNSSLTLDQALSDHMNAAAKHGPCVDDSSWGTLGTSNHESKGFLPKQPVALTLSRKSSIRRNLGAGLARSGSSRALKVQV